MFAKQYRVVLLLGLVTALLFYLVMPLALSYLLTIGLHRAGYAQVMVQLGYPGLRSIRVPVLAFQQDLGGEWLSVSLTDVTVRYQLFKLIRGQVDQVSVPEVALQILNVHRAVSAQHGEEKSDQADLDDSPWTLLTAGDLLRNLPILPFDELQLDRLTIFRERATGPLRRLTVSGTIRHRDGELESALTFQGQETGSYGLAFLGRSATNWSATLMAQPSHGLPILSWQSRAQVDGTQIRIKGTLEVNVQELAPFIALAVPIGADLGKVTGKIAVHWTGVAPAESALTNVWRDERAKLNGEIHAAITLPTLKGIAKNITLACDATFRGSAMQLDWAIAPGVLFLAQINAQSRILPLPDTVRRFLPRGDQAFQIANKGPVQGTLSWADRTAHLTAGGPMLVTYGQSGEPFIAEFEANRAESSGTETLSVEGRYHVRGQLPGGLTQLLSAAHAAGDIQGTASLSTTHLQALVSESSFLKAEKVEQGGVTVPSVMLQLAENLSVHCELVPIHCTADPGKMTIRMPMARIQGHTLRMAQGSVRLDHGEFTGGSWNLEGVADLHSLTPELGSWRLPMLTTRVTFTVDQGRIQAESKVNLPQREGLLTARVEQIFGEGVGSVHATIGPVRFDGEDRRLRRLIMGLPQNLDFTGGRVTVDIDGSWTKETIDLAQGLSGITGRARVVVDELSVRYLDHDAKGISSTWDLRTLGGEGVAMVKPATVMIASMSTGVELRNVTTMFRATWRFADALPVVELQDLRCEAFGGTVSIQGTVVDWAKLPVQTKVSLQGLDLAKILSVELQQEIQGVGTLNGTLPLTMTRGGVTVKEGIVEAQPPGGIIRYVTTPGTATLMSKTDNKLELVSKALRNFHYTVLRVGVDYAENGTLLLTARLEGRNPDLRDIPPVNFNLTVQEHIPTLLRSLRIAQDIESAVGEQYKRP